MKYWRGYLVAGILAAISLAFTSFAKAHSVLADMIYPYISRMLMTTLAQSSSGVSFNLWQLWLFLLIGAAVATVVLTILLRWNPVQLIGWALAVVSCICLCNNLLYGLNRYCSPLADDMHLEVTDYTVSELNEATLYFRDQANALALEVPRDKKGRVAYDSFATLAEQAGEGYENLMANEMISVFSGSTAPVKKQGLFAFKGNSGVTIPITGEASVNPNVPAGALPFAMCHEMAHRMSIYSDTDANLAAFLACYHHSDLHFRYSAYLMAYHYCYEALSSVPTATAKTCAEETDKGLNDQLRKDLEDVAKFYGKSEKTDSTHVSQKQDETQEETSVVTFSQYSHTSDLLANWYIDKFILPLHREEDLPFDPYDPNQVDLSGLVNAGD